MVCCFSITADRAAAFKVGTTAASTSNGAAPVTDANGSWTEGISSLSEEGPYLVVAEGISVATTRALDVAEACIIAAIPLSFLEAV